ncbi:hypothetical protein Q31a_07490 [Aureliella helgolandensis]|uniref:DUF1570 domain-containing protein n=1 Tax=Aureliella helgolandensis TaxID=2527968 RepID=A0A518G1M9_9BACT|nr:hypothetical protein Q31a_07490 [Aureliella helgolandensis]
MHALVAEPRISSLSRRFLIGVGLSWSCGLMLNLAAAAEGDDNRARNWPVELRVGQFKIHADFELTEREGLAAELQHLTADVSGLLSIELSQAPVHVVLFATAAEYRRYMENYFPSLPTRRALFVQDRGPGMLFTYWHPQVATDLRHEVTHALVNAHASSLPLWFDEGLAEYFEVERDRRFQGNPYLPQILERSKAGYVPALEQLESVDDIARFDNSQYRDSWSWVHFMLHRSPQTRQLLTRYLTTQRSGESQLSLSRQLRQFMADPEREYSEHFTRSEVETGLAPNAGFILPAQ